MSRQGDATRLRPPSGPERRIKRRLAVAAPGAVLLIAAGVSLAGHAGAILAAWDRPMGYVDPAMLQSEPKTMRVRRARVDEFRAAPGPDGLRAGLEPDIEPELDAEAVTRELLEELSLPEAAMEVEVRLRELAEQPPAEAGRDVSLDLPAFELDEAVLSELESGGRPDDLAYSRESGFEGERATLGGRDEGGLRARDLLASATGDDGGTGSGEGGGGGGTALERPPGGERGGFDRRLLLPGGVGPNGGTGGDALVPVAIDVPESTGDGEPAESQPLDDDFDYTLFRYRPEPGWLNRDPGDGYFRMDVTPRRSLQKLKAMPKDVVYLVDTSSSLPQRWVDATIAGVESSLAGLNRGDRFNVVLFNESPRLLTTGEPLPASPETVRRAGAFLRGARSQGYTDVNAALRSLLVRDRDRGRVYYLVLISDGRPTRGVIDTRRLIDLITRDNDLSASIYCVGVGDRQDRELLDFLAYRNKGRSVFVEDADRAAAAINDLMSRLRYPLIRGVSYAVLGVDADRVYPKALPNIHQGQTLSIYGRYEDPRDITMRVVGVSGAGPVDFLFTRELDAARETDDELATQWAKWKLHHLYDRVLREGRTDELIRGIREIEREYDLRTLY